MLSVQLMDAGYLHVTFDKQMKQCMFLAHSLVCL